MTRECINALTLEDLKSVGIPLADTILLEEKFNTKRGAELKGLVESVRRKGSNKIKEKQSDRFNNKRKVILLTSNLHGIILVKYKISL